MASSEKRMTEEDLNTILTQEMNNSTGVADTKLSEDQGDAIARYLGELYGTEVDGRSHFVSRDFMDTIEWIMPTLMDIYYSTDTPVTIQPQNESDILGAEQETAYLSFVINRKNDGFQIIHNFAKDGLLQKIGIIKHWWDESTDAKEVLYEQLTQGEMEALLSKDDTTVIEHTVFLDGKENDDAVDDPDALHDLRVTHQSTHGQIRLENVPHEEFRISRKATRRGNAPYMAHITHKTVSELIDMGFDQKLVEGLAEESAMNEGNEISTMPQFIARYDQDSTDPEEFLSDRSDTAMKTLRLEEHYLKVDWNGDGVAEIRQIFRINKTLLINEEIPDYPFTFWSPIMMPHKLIGLSMVDLVQDLQKIKTHLTRAMLDNINSANNGGYTVLQGMVNIEDLMTTGPLRIIRQKVPDAVRRLDQPQLPAEAFQMLSYIDQVRQERVGVSPLQQGMDDKVLGSNTAAMAVSQMMTAAQQRIQLIARVLAETGLKELYRAIHRLALLHRAPQEVFQLHENFISVDPSQWRSRTDFTVTVGTGHANKDQKLLHLQMLSQDTAQVIQAGGLGSLVSAKNIYNLMKEKYLAAGFKDYAKFITDPDTIQDQGPSEEEQLQKAAIQQDMQIKEREMRVKEAEAMIKEAEAKIKAGEAQVSGSKAQAEIAEIQHNARIRELETLIKEEELKLKKQELELEKTQQRPVKIGN